MQQWLAWNPMCGSGSPHTQLFACLCLVSAVIKGMHHHNQPFLCHTIFYFIKTGSSVSSWSVSQLHMQLKMTLKSIFLSSYPKCQYCWQSTMSSVCGVQDWNDQASCMLGSTLPTELQPSLSDNDHGSKCCLKVVFFFKSLGSEMQRGDNFITKKVPPPPVSPPRVQPCLFVLELILDQAVLQLRDLPAFAFQMLGLKE